MLTCEQLRHTWGYLLGGIDPFLNLLEVAGGLWCCLSHIALGDAVLPKMHGAC